MAALLATALLAGCQKFTVLFPSGYVAAQQRDLLVWSVILMLLIIVPLFIATIIIAVRYRESNPKSSYAPEWEHSTKIELLIWAAPLLIVIVLGAMTWISSHLLDPFADLARIDEDTPIPKQVEPLQVKVVALDWKWLFLYPEYDVATVGEVAAPVNVPIQFSITATDVMNSFFIPALAGQVYAMPAMRTELSAVINEVGTYKGISANFSGHGFNHMDFEFLGLSKAKFKQWIARVKSSGKTLTKAEYVELSKPGIVKSVKYYNGYVNDLFRAIVLRCFSDSAACESRQPMQHASAPHSDASADGREVAATASNH